MFVCSRKKSKPDTQTQDRCRAGFVCVSGFAGRNRFQWLALRLHDVLLLRLDQRIDLAFKMLGQILHAFLGLIVDIFAHRLVLKRDIGVLVGIAANVANGDATVFRQVL